MARKKNKRKPQANTQNEQRQNNNKNKADKGPPPALMWMIGIGLVAVVALAALSDRETPKNSVVNQQDSAEQAQEAVASKPDDKSATAKTDSKTQDRTRRDRSEGKRGNRQSASSLIASLPDDAGTFGGDKDKATTFKGLVKKANIPGAARRVEKDVTAFHNKLGDAPGYAESAVLTSWVQLEARKASLAEKTASKALSAEPGKQKAALETIVLQSQLAQVGKGQKADPALLDAAAAKITELDDDALKASLTYQLAKGLNTNGKTDETIARYKEVARVYPDSQEAPKALYDLGQLYSAKENPKEAIASYKQLIKNYPKSSSIKRAKSSVKMLEIIGSSGEDIQASEWVNFDPGTLDKDLSGKVVMYMFWASWCPHCKREMPHMVELYNKYKDEGLVIVGVTNADKRQSRDKIVSYLESEAVPFPVAIQDGRGGQRTYAVSGIPAAALVDKTGIIRWRNHPARNIEAEIKKLLKENSPS